MTVTEIFKERIIFALTTLMLLTVLLIGCTNSPQEWDFTDADLLIDVTDMPEGWKAAEYTDNYPYDTEGADNQAFRKFSFQPTTYLVKAGNDVYHYRSPSTANRGYRAIIDRYMGQRASDLGPWETPPEFEFASSTADQWIFACVYSSFAPASEFGSKRRNCKFLAQYEEYVIEFSATMEVDDTTFMTLEEITNVIETIDQTMSEHLQP